MRKNVKVEQLLHLLQDEVLSLYGNTDRAINNISDAQHTTETTLDWINSNKDNKQYLAETSVAKVLIVDKDVTFSKKIESQDKTLIVVKNPKRAIAIVGNKWFTDSFLPGIHATSIIDPEAYISEKSTIGPFVQIGKAKIGDGTVISANVRIYDDVVIGDYCYIKEGAVIGGPGFGYEIDEDGNRFRFPQIGGVIIGDHVDIGANSCIDRGALSDTVIEDYAKIDNLCHIAHNVHIGKNAMITACSLISGSCNVGENAWVGPNTSVRDWRNIGADATVGIGSNVVKDVPPKEIWAGNPAKSFSKK